MKKYITIILFTLVAFANVSMANNWEKEKMNRIKLDFRLSEAQVKEYIGKYIPNVTEKQMRQWEKSKALEYMIIDGQKRHFNNAGPNLFRIESAAHAIKVAKDGMSLSNSDKDDEILLPQIINAVKQTGYDTVMPKHMRVTYTLTVKPNMVPDGKIIRCWLPFPRRDIRRQQQVKLLGTGEEKYTLSPLSCKHSTLYMEKKAVKDKPTVFTESFEYTPYGEWHNLKPEDIQPYDTTSTIYKEYTSERKTHIRFSPRIRKLAAELTKGETNPLIKARNIFTWIHKHFPWASAREYSTIDNIPEYVLDNHHGDCGQVSLLFITLCRCSGIPAHFQSGFMMHPGDSGMHDWSEIYFQGIGWVPVDQSFGIPPYAKNDEERMFFLGGIDSWRMTVNSDYSMPLVPKKKFPRSETVDFQRGEVEWEGGNLYFDKWNYNMDITYF